MKAEIKFMGKVESKDWPHFLWDVKINGVSFAYKTGLGHASAPQIDYVLNCLFSDANAGAMSFDDFCADFDYSNDSLKALDIYRACAATIGQLKAALGKDYHTEKERIEALEL